MTIDGGSDLLSLCDLLEAIMVKEEWFLIVETMRMMKKLAVLETLWMLYFAM